MKINMVEQIDIEDVLWEFRISTDSIEEFNDLRGFVDNYYGKASNSVNNAPYTQRDELMKYIKLSDQKLDIPETMSATIGGDAVNNPSHYQGKGGLEVYDVMKAFLTDEEITGWHKACALKYILRAGKKDPAKRTEDIQKAGWHLKQLAQGYDL